MRKFYKLYQCYKNDFDLEMYLDRNKQTYQEFEQKQIENEEWF